MQKRFLFRLLSFSFGIALLLAALFFDRGTAVSSPQLQSTPTPDRLAQPTLPPAPSQADHGAQVYWLSCLPCHGDRGQGLTDEFRQTYPEEEQNCWESGCHGERPYEHGFTLPRQIPALVGPNSLQKFPDAAALHAYIAAAMPFWKPGSLSPEDAWSVTAFLLRQNGLWDGQQELDSSTAALVHLGPGPAPTLPSQDLPPSRSPAWPFAAAVALAAATLALGFFLKRTRKP